MNLNISKSIVSILLAVNVLGIVNTSAQNNSKKENNKKYAFAETLPKPEYDFYKYLYTNIKYPPKALKYKIQGTVYVEFVVTKKGEIKKVRVVKGKEIGGGLQAEAVRIITKMPKWKPGMLDGKIADVYFTVPIKFAIQ